MAIGKKTGGRKAGTPNKRTAGIHAANRKLLDKAAKTLGATFEGDAYCLLRLAYQNEDLDFSVRMAAAQAAIKYERPALAASTINMTVSASRAEDLTDDELAAIALGGAKQLPAPNQAPIELQVAPIDKNSE